MLRSSYRAARLPFEGPSRRYRRRFPLFRLLPLLRWFRRLGPFHLQALSLVRHRQRPPLRLFPAAAAAPVADAAANAPPAEAAAATPPIPVAAVTPPVPVVAGLPPALAGVPAVPGASALEAILQNLYGAGPALAGLPANVAAGALQGLSAPVESVSAAPISALAPVQRTTRRQPLRWLQRLQ